MHHGDDPPPSGPGLLAGRFELGDAIGRGGSAVVHRARDRQTGETVAVKLVDPDALGRERFAREASALRALTAPGIVRYVAHGADRDRLYLVEEWLPGHSLRAQLAGDGVTAGEAVRVARDAAAALAAAHAAGIVHRDIKPEHLWLTRAPGAPAPGDRDALGRVTLIDFGIARGVRDPRVTATGAAVGTPGYMAPEQACGERAIDPRTDVFALGAVLFEALTGTAAFVGRSDSAVRAKVLVARPPALAPRCPEAPPALVALVDAMLAKQPADRPRDAAAVVDALAAIALAAGPRRRVATVESPATRPAAAGAPPRSFVIAAGHAAADPALLAVLAGAPVERVDGALWLAVVRASAGRAQAIARAWHDLLGTPVAVAAGDDLDAAVEWAADAVARAALLGELADFAAPPPAIQLDPVTRALVAG